MDRALSVIKDYKIGTLAWSWHSRKIAFRLDSIKTFINLAKKDKVSV